MGLHSAQEQHMVQQERARTEPVADRPHMPGYGIKEGPEGQLAWEWVAERMAASRNYWVAATRPDGRPNVRPVWGVWLDGTLYFSTGRQTLNGRGWAVRPDTVVHLESGDEVVILEGTVEEMTDSELFGRYADAYDAKYQFRPEPDPANLVLALRPRVVFAWREKDFPESATRFRCDAGTTRR
jgi:hypothetical protein